MLTCADRVYEKSKIDLKEWPAFGLKPGVIGRVGDEGNHTGSFNPEKNAIYFGEFYLEHASEDDLEAVIGHEIGHKIEMHYVHATRKASRDAEMFFVTAFACTLVAFAPTMPSFFKQPFMKHMAAVSGIMSATALFVGKHVSREMEYRADAIAAAFTSPQQMINSFHNIETLGIPVIRTFNQFMDHHGLPNPLATHPHTKKRIAALERLENTPEGQAFLQALRDKYTNLGNRPD